MNNGTKIGLLIINILTIGFFINAVHNYTHRQKIIYKHNSLNPKSYKVIELNCKYGRNSHSKVLIEYKKKQYSIPILYKECIKWNQGGTPPSFYSDLKNDKIITESNLTIRMLIIGAIMVIFFLSFWHSKIWKLLNKK
jgi:hypothetical protein